MRHLRSLQALIIVLAGFLTSTVDAQHNKGNYNFREFQAKPYYFGLTFGYNHSNFQLLHSNRFILNDSFNISEGLGGSGLNVSIIGNLKLGEYFDFRFLPGFSFVGRKLYYVNAVDQLEQIKAIESVLVQIPFQVRFKSDPFHDMRIFVLAGAKYTFDVASNAQIRQEQANRIIRISPHDYSLEIGAGCQFFLPFFIFSPEIKYSQGIGNILIYNSKLAQSTVLEKILSRTFTISLHFEG
jgi:hypothetical protein